MAQYIMMYLGGNPPSTPKEGMKHFSEYQKWLSSLGDAVVSPANPFRDTHTVHPDGTAIAESTTSMSGFSIIEATSIEEALKHAKTCPFLDIGGTLEVSELVKMPT